MNAKAVIVIANELNYSIPLFVENCENHIEGLKKYIYHNDINLSKITNISIQEASIDLGEQGYTVILYDKEENYRNLVIYLPQEISPKQYEWFNKRKKGLENYNLMIADNTHDNNWNSIDETITDKPIITELFRLLDEKLIKSTKTRVKTKNYEGN